MSLTDADSGMLSLRTKICCAPALLNPPPLTPGSPSGYAYVLRSPTNDIFTHRNRVFRRQTWRNCWIWRCQRPQSAVSAYRPSQLVAMLSTPRSQFTQLRPACLWVRL